jgi:hypothetical protein
MAAWVARFGDNLQPERLSRMKKHRKRSRNGVKCDTSQRSGHFFDGTGEQVRSSALLKRMELNHLAGYIVK